MDWMTRLSRKGRLTARQLVQVNHALYTHPNWRYEAMAAMAIFGRDGTVKNRLKGSPARDSVRAKTGSMSGVAAITGVAQAQSGDTLLFALLINEMENEKVAFPIWEQMVDSLVRTCPSGVPSP